MARRNFDWKQLFFSLIGVAFAIGIVFLIITHIGQQVSRTAHDSPHSESIEANGLASSASGSVVNNADYRFFELLDAPAPERDLPTVSLATNPAIEARRQAKLERRAKARADRKKARDEARAIAKAEPAEVEKPAAKPADTPVAAAAAKPEPKKTAEEKPEPVEAVVAKVEPEKKADAKPEKKAERHPAEVAAVALAPEKTKKAEEKPEPEKKKAEEEKKSSRKAFTVQVSAFQDPKAADALASDLKSQGYRAHVKREEVPGKGSWYRVRVGRFSSRDDAKSFQKKIADKQGLPGFVTGY